MASKFIKGGFQRLLETFLYFILFLCNAIILGFYSYFLSVLADRNIHIPTYEKAVEGISGAACVYLILATILTCCLGGITGFAVIAIILDLCFAAGMVGIIVLTRHGASSCKGNHVQSPLGDGPANADNGFGNDKATYSVHLGLACRFNTVCFAVAIIAAILFLCTAAMQILLMRHHKKEKRVGPSPDNNYTSGYGKKKRFGFGSKNKNSSKAAEAGAYTSANNNNRVSHETGYTGTTANTGYNGATTNGTGYENYKNEGYTSGQGTQAAQGAHSGYYTAPTGTEASNPYGYQNHITSAIHPSANNTSTNY